MGHLCLSTALRDPREFPDRAFKYVDISSIDRGTKCIVNVQSMLGAEAPSRARKEVEAGDVLVSTVRPKLNAVALVGAHLHGAIASTGFCVLRADPRVVEPRFLFFFCRTQQFVDVLSERVRGAHYPAVTDADVKNSPLSVPPLAEQRAIVEILDQADRLRRLRAEADANADRILPALLAQALGSPSRWPTDPRSRPLGDLVHPVSGATPSKTNQKYWNGRVPWVSPKDMKRDFLSDTEDHVSQLALDETNLTVVEPGNVLIVVRGMILARDVPVALNLSPVTINQDMKALVPRSDEITGSFLWATLKLGRTMLQPLVRTAGHGTRKLDTPELMQFPLVVPSPEQLAQIESAVREHRLLVERRRISGAMINALFALLLSRAFEGSLTVSWREAHMNELVQEIEHQTKALAALARAE